MFPGFAKPVVVVLLLVAGAAGGVQVEDGSASQVLNIEVSAASSDEVTVSSQRVLMVAHEWAYTHQYPVFVGFQLSGPREPLDRFADAVTAIRCFGSDRSL